MNRFVSVCILNFYISFHSPCYFINELAEIFYCVITHEINYCRSFAMTHIDNSFPQIVFLLHYINFFGLRSWCGKQILTKWIMRKVNLFNFAQVETVFPLHSPYSYSRCVCTCHTDDGLLGCFRHSLFIINYSVSMTCLISAKLLLVPFSFMYPGVL